MSDKKETSVKSTKDIKEKVDLGLLEEDDEFEEFPAEGELLWWQQRNQSINSNLDDNELTNCWMIFSLTDWQGKDNDEELTIWEDNWDDDDIEDDFSKQLK